MRKSRQRKQRRSIAEALELRRLLAAASATFTRTVVSSTNQFYNVPADWDGDGDIDLLGTTSATPATFSLLVQQPDHTFVTRSVGANNAVPSGTNNTNGVLAADLNGDGLPDLINPLQSGSNTLLSWQLNQGNGVLGAPLTKTVPQISGRPIVADLDRDGDLDIALPQGNFSGQPNHVAILLNDGAGNLADPSFYDGLGTTTNNSAAGADIDRDGDIDLIVPSYDQTNKSVLRTLVNNGRAGFVPGESIALSTGFTDDAVAAADLDDDGDVDLVCTTGASFSSANTVALYNDGTGHFASPVALSGTNGNHEVLSAVDLNGDSFADLVGEPGNLYWNNGTGTLAYGSTIGLSSLHMRDPIDVNGDGRRDITDNSGSVVYFGGGFTDTLSPVASRGRLVYAPQIGAPSIEVDFSEPVRGNASRLPRLSVKNLSTGITLDSTTLKTISDAGDKIQWLLPTTLADGNYQATITASGALDVAGRPLAANYVVDFFVLAADANHDRHVDAADQAILNSNFGQSGRTFAQGDFNFSGTVDAADQALLTNNLKVWMPAPGVFEFPVTSADDAWAVRHTSSSTFDLFAGVQDTPAGPTFRVLLSGVTSVMYNAHLGNDTFTAIGNAAANVITYNNSEIVIDGMSFLHSGIETRGFKGYGGFDSLTINDGPIVVAYDMPVLATLSIAPIATLDLADNDLLVKNTPRATIQNYIKSAYNFGDWNGPSGITSSTAKNKPVANTTLGLLSGLEFNTNNGGTFNGLSVSNSDVLVKYTYFGDVDFNGSIDASDYNLVDFGFSNHLTGWAWGDAEYSGGPTDVSDYNLIDFAFATQSSAL